MIYLENPDLLHLMTASCVSFLFSLIVSLRELAVIFLNRLLLSSYLVWILHSDGFTRIDLIRSLSSQLLSSVYEKIMGLELIRS